MKSAVIGQGSFGRALRDLLAQKWGAENVSVWRRGMDMESCLRGAACAVFAVPTQAFREVLSAACAFLAEETVVINAAKGIELSSLLRLSEVAEQVRPGTRYAALSGPSHAEEIEQGLPTAVTVCARESEWAEKAQQLFMTEAFRVYTGTDMIGTETGGALKNVIALAAGISDGLGYGDNTKAALMTRGMAEITRLGTALGAKAETFLGLTGFGDLIVTCTSMHSRNRRCGILLGQGVPAEEAVKRIGMVVEGISTARAARTLAERLPVRMPITETVCAILDGALPPREAAAQLMTREGRPE